MGVQSLNEDTLKEIHRKPSSEIYRAMRVLEEGIIPNVSVDFII
jgi:coproporphyrinogen III oxidase-like Fe-S oxidoreductase